MYRVVVKTAAADRRYPAEVWNEVVYSRAAVDVLINHALVMAPADLERTITVVFTPDQSPPIGWGGRGPVRLDDDEIGCCSTYS